MTIIAWIFHNAPSIFSCVMLIALAWHGIDEARKSKSEKTAAEINDPWQNLVAKYSEYDHSELMSLCSRLEASHQAEIRLVNELAAAQLEISSLRSELDRIYKEDR